MRCRTPSPTRSHRPASLALKSCALLLGIGLLSCQPPKRILDDTNPEETPPDMAVPPPCALGGVRCAKDGATAEVCDRTGWKLAATCDAQKGELCADGLCVSACDRLPRGNVGCTFYPANLWSTSTAGEFGIVVSNTSDRLVADVTLADASGMIDKQTAPPGGVVTFRLPHSRNKLSQTEQAKKSFLLKSTAPVAVYQFHPIDAAQVFSGSATLLLPEHVMAKNYFVTSYTYNAAIITTPPQGQGLLAVTAIEDNTQVQITVPVATAAGAGVPGIARDGTLTRVLNRLETLEVMQANSEEDISGATVLANKRVVVYGGAGGVTVPRNAIGGNHFGVQMFPLETWGKRYVAAKFKRRNATDQDYYRIIASVNNTHVTLKGAAGLPTVPVLSKSQIFEFATELAFELNSDQPVWVMQHMPAWGNLTGRYSPMDFPDGVSASCPYMGSVNDVRCLGDANITPLVPVEQHRNDYIFYVPKSYTYDYILVTAPQGTKLTLDKLLISDPLTPILDSTLGHVTLRLQPGYHRIQGSAEFGLLGFGYSYATSYSYAGGLNLDKINPVE